MPHLKVLHTSLEALNIHRGGIFLNSYRDPCDYQIYSLSLQRNNFRNYVEKDYKNSHCPCYVGSDTYLGTGTQG